MPPNDKFKWELDDVEWYDSDGNRIVAEDVDGPDVKKKEPENAPDASDTTPKAADGSTH